MTQYGFRQGLECLGCGWYIGRGTRRERGTGSRLYRPIHSERHDLVRHRVKSVSSRGQKVASEIKHESPSQDGHALDSGNADVGLGSVFEQLCV